MSSLLEFYKQSKKGMDSIYLNFENWPIPHDYMRWHEIQDLKTQQIWMHPIHYTAFYEWAAKEKVSTKPSRRKRRIARLRKLKEQLQEERKSIGKLVQLQRKDLISGIRRLEDSAQRAKQKKKEKFAYLIEINKEVSKQYRKRGEEKKNGNRVKIDSSKKRLSCIKKAKKKLEEMKDQEWVADEQQKGEKQLENKQIKKINYTQVGRLSGLEWEGVRLRQWCRNVPSRQLQELSLRLINRLAYKQAMRKVQRGDKAKKLIVAGLKECKRTLRSIIQNKKSKLLILALNVERNNLSRGSDDQVQKILNLASEVGVSVIHTSTRAHLGRAFTGKMGPRVTVVSIIDYEGYRDMHQLLLQEWMSACQQYESL